MATLNSVLEFKTVPGSAGVVPYSLPPNFDPKIVIALCSYQTATAFTAPGNTIFTMGIGTKDGGSIQQFAMNNFGATGQAASNDQNGHATTAILRGGPTTPATATAGAATTDFVISLSDLVTGASSSYSIDYSDLPATGSLRVAFLVLGGDAITAARVGAWTETTGAANHTESFPGGWGKPDGGMILSVPWTGTAAGIMNTEDMGFTLGIGNTASQSDAFTIMFHDNEGATMATATWGKSARMSLSTGAAVGADTEMQFSTTANFPTDGFRVDYPDTTGFPFVFGYLMWKGPMTVGVNGLTARTTTGNTTVPGIVGSTAKAAIFASHMGPSGALNTASALGGGMMVGMTDGANQVCASGGQDNGNAASACWRDWSETTALRQIQPNVTATLAAAATATLSGADAVLNFTTVDASNAREYGGWVFGVPAAAATSFPFPNRVARNMLLRR